MIFNLSSSKNYSIYLFSFWKDPLNITLFGWVYVEKVTKITLLHLAYLLKKETPYSNNWHHKIFLDLPIFEGLIVYFKRPYYLVVKSS